MPVRKVSNRGGNIIGRFPSLKMGRMIAFESLLERDFIYLLDYEAQVERFEEQPLTIEYRHEDQTLHYTPDFHLIEAGQSVLVECKPDHFIDTEENRRKFAVAREWCVNTGWEFRVVTDHQVRAGWRLAEYQTIDSLCPIGSGPAALSNRIGLRPRGHRGFDAAGGWHKRSSRTIPTPIIASLLHLGFHHVLELPLDTRPCRVDAGVLSGAAQSGGATMSQHESPVAHAFVGAVSCIRSFASYPRVRSTWKTY